MKTKSWLLPFLGMALITPFTPWLDRTIAHTFYLLGDGTIEHFISTPWINNFSSWALLPGQIAVFLATGGYLLSYLFSRYRTFRPHCLLLVLTLAVGAGFVVNVLLKDHWGRPRPKQVVEFGGYQLFRPYYQPNFFHQPEPSKSFPCGHCTMGFYFFALAIAARRAEVRWLEKLGWILAWGLGIGLGLARMAQGAHFLSDVLASALIMWWIALFFEWLIYDVLEEENFSHIE